MTILRRQTTDTVPLTRDKLLQATSLADGETTMLAIIVYLLCLARRIHHAVNAICMLSSSPVSNIGHEQVSLIFHCLFSIKSNKSTKTRTTAPTKRNGPNNAILIHTSPPVPFPLESHSSCGLALAAARRAARTRRNAVLITAVPLP